MDTDTRRGLDLWLVSICMASAWIAWMYLEEGRLRWWVMICGSAGTLFFLLLALLEGKLGALGSRIGKLLFKLVVQQDMIANITAAPPGI